LASGERLAADADAASRRAGGAGGPPAAARVWRFYDGAPSAREQALRAVCDRDRGGGFRLTTYGMMQYNADSPVYGTGAAATKGNGKSTSSTSKDGGGGDDEAGAAAAAARVPWDVVVLDEAHKAKNPASLTARGVRCLRAPGLRLAITGTLVLNDLAEMHALLDWAAPGLHGGAAEFKARFARPIAAGQDRSAGLVDRQQAAAPAHELRGLVAPHMLRRERDEVLTVGRGGPSPAPESSLSSSAAAAAPAAAAAIASAAGGPSNGGSAASPAPPAGAAVPARLGRKTDLIVWLRLQPLQRHVYEAFLNSDTVRSALNTRRRRHERRAHCRRPARRRRRRQRWHMRRAARRCSGRGGRPARSAFWPRPSSRPSTRPRPRQRQRTSARKGSRERRQRCRRRQRRQRRRRPLAPPISAPTWRRCLPACAWPGATRGSPWVSTRSFTREGCLGSDARGASGG